MYTKNWLKFAIIQTSSIAVVIALICAQTRPATAQEKAPAAEDTSAKQQAEQPNVPPTGKEEKDEPVRKQKPSLTDRLIKELTDQAKEQAGNPLDAIVERMRAAQQKLQQTETDKDTRDLQTQIVKDLDALIEQLKNAKSTPQKPNQDQQPPPMGGNDQNVSPRGQGQPKPQNSLKQSGGPDKKSMQPAGSSQGEKSKQSANQNQGQPRTPEEEAAREKLAKDVWGHLPPALRQQLLNVYSEKFLPKYDDLVRKYYEALAEQNRRNP
jgi:hypothetical protein